MSALDDIPIQTESAASTTAPRLVDAILHELIQLLDNYLASGEVGAIDLRSLPLSPDDRGQLQQALGKGEISASARLSGDTDIYETEYAGVWWISHRNLHNDIIAEHLEVAEVPAIIGSHKADMKQARERLANRQA